MRPGDCKTNNTNDTNGHGFVGTSLSMRALYEKIGNVASSDAAVFIQGETGTGKELCAEAIHAASSRADGPFVPVNCGAIPHDLMESEMFGHLKGSFTGAIANRDGAAKMADGGTLFLDEVCELAYDLQAKLLRFLQTGYIQPVGASRALKVDVRIVCATNKDPRMEMAEGRFRQDLFYRLFVLPLNLPPLRARGADIILVANHFLKKYSRQESKDFTRFSDTAMSILENHDWPGNIREVQNVIRMAVVMNNGPVVESSMLSELLGEADHMPKLDVSAFNVAGPSSVQTGRFRFRQLWQIERDAIEAAIVGCDGSIPKAAEKLGVSPSTIYRKRESWNGEGQAV
ncbi:Response regulator of zinc sigma-54-dependent two-component system [hydrothermal vent metagenome]|uniref:Response regulator of zinc sigma-54-dependent two-component system n=1 Tax=hydrothermal vent metagenome TaxID=652676 RepID=A0A3B0R924_9ZZZZ